MGLTLDSSVVIAAERRGDTPTQLVRQIVSAVCEDQLAIASVALTELVHGIFRATYPQVRSRREAFINELLTDIEVVPYTQSTAFLAGRIDGEQRTIGVTIPSLDLLIGATALEIGYGVLTANVRHFQLIPGLKIVTL